MRVLVDTNILLRSARPTHPLCSQATYAVSKLLRQKDAVFFCSQNIAESWNVATRPAEVNGLGLSHAEALEEVASIETLLTLLPDTPAIYPVWKRPCHPAFNVADFKRFGNASAHHPASMLA
jgi:predicted nucleic acid-binding protein